MIAIMTQKCRNHRTHMKTGGKKKKKERKKILESGASLKRLVISRDQPKGVP
jgi:hypothetical protein